MAADLGRRFAELIQQADTIEAKKTPLTGEFAGLGMFEVNATALLNWQVKARQLLFATCGENSHQLSTFHDNKAERVNDFDTSGVVI
jgi:hypothetical protein